jgi:hypothetical protein
LEEDCGRVGGRKTKSRKKNRTGGGVQTEGGSWPASSFGSVLEEGRCWKKDQLVVELMLSKKKGKKGRGDARMHTMQCLREEQRGRAAAAAAPAAAAQ